MAVNVWRYEGELTWFFSDGQSAFERSTCGDMLERAEQFGFGSDGIRIEHRDKVEERVRLFWQGLCAKPAEVLDQDTVDEFRSLIPWSDLDPSITACPQPVKASEPSVMPDDHKLRRYARASRALNRIALQHRTVLALYFGNRGCFWELQKLGRVMSIMHETKAGRKLLKICPSDSGELRQDERIAQAWDSYRATADPKKGVLLKEAERQARNALRHAKREYEIVRSN